LRAVEDDRPHADETRIADATAVQDDIVADDAILADAEWEARVGVQRGIVLNLRTRPDVDPFIVAAEYRAPPDANIGMKAHAPDHRGGLGDPVKAVAG